MNETHLKLLQSLAEKIGTTAEQLWPHWVRYVVADAVTALLVALLLSVAVAWGLRVVWKRCVPDDSYSDAVMYRFVATIIATCVWAVSIAIIACAIPVLINPVGYIVSRLAR